MSHILHVRYPSCPVVVSPLHVYIWWRVQIIKIFVIRFSTAQSLSVSNILFIPIHIYGIQCSYSTTFLNWNLWKNTISYSHTQWIYDLIPWRMLLNCSTVRASFLGTMHIRTDCWQAGSQQYTGHVEWRRKRFVALLWGLMEDVVKLNKLLSCEVKRKLTHRWSRCSNNGLIKPFTAQGSN